MNKKTVSIDNAPLLDDHDTIVFAKPSFYDVKYAINVYQLEFLNQIDLPKAIEQWEMMRLAFKLSGFKTEVITPQIGLPDQVYVTDPGRPFIDHNGQKRFLAANFKYPQRVNELNAAIQFYENKNYQIDRVSSLFPWEGGDLIKVPGRHFYLCGHGFRTELSSIQHLSQALNTYVVALQLVKDEFYHLDTCLFPIWDDTLMLYPPAFSGVSIDILKELFKNIILISKEEALLFACNGRRTPTKLIMQNGALKPETKMQIQLLGDIKKKEIGFIEVDLSEFLKGGGSVRCCTNVHFEEKLMSFN